MYGAMRKLQAYTTERLDGTWLIWWGINYDHVRSQKPYAIFANHEYKVNCQICLLQEIILTTYYRAFRIQQLASRLDMNLQMR